MERWSLTGDVLLARYKFEDNFKYGDNVNVFDSVFFFFDLVYLKFNTLIRLQSPNYNNFRPFINIGLSNSFAIKSTNNRKIDNFIYSTRTLVQGDAIERYRKWQQSLVFGTGLNYKRISLEYRFDLGNGMSDYADLKSILISHFILFGYKFYY